MKELITIQTTKGPIVVYYESIIITVQRDESGDMDYQVIIGDKSYKINEQEHKRIREIIIKRRRASNAAESLFIWIAIIATVISLFIILSK